MSTRERGMSQKWESLPWTHGLPPQWSKVADYHRIANGFYTHLILCLSHFVGYDKLDFRLLASYPQFWCFSSHFLDGHLSICRATLLQPLKELIEQQAAEHVSKLEAHQSDWGWNHQATWGQVELERFSNLDIMGICTNRKWLKKVSFDAGTGPDASKSGFLFISLYTLTILEVHWRLLYPGACNDVWSGDLHLLVGHDPTYPTNNTPRIKACSLQPAYERYTTTEFQT